MGKQDGEQIKHHMGDVIKPGGNLIQIIHRQHGDYIKHNMTNGIYQHSNKAAIVLSHFIITGVDTEKYQQYQAYDLRTDDQ